MCRSKKKGLSHTISTRMIWLSNCDLFVGDGEWVPSKTIPFLFEDLKLHQREDNSN